MKIGFIGLGIMGAPMARRLMGTDNAVYLHSRSGVPSDLIAAGAMACSDPSEVALNADLIFTMLPDTSDVEIVLFGERGVLEGLSHGKLVVDMSSVSPTATRVFASRIRNVGCGYLDAPVSGGEIGAREGTLSVMVGGAADDVERARPVFEKIGKTIVHVGSECGDGQVAKCANQIVVALTINAVAEGLLFASRAGANVAAVHRALMGGLASSRILEVHGKRMREGTFEPGFRIVLHRKDLKNALDAASSMELPLPATAQVQQFFDACCANGMGELDHSGLLRSLEQLAAHSVSGNGRNCAQS